MTNNRLFIAALVNQITATVAAGRYAAYGNPVDLGVAVYASLLCLMAIMMRVR